MATIHRPLLGPDSVRSGVAVAPLGELVTKAEEPLFEAHLNLVKTAPGAALLVWGPDAICLAYNRAYRSLAALRASALGKPLFLAQPELERTWRTKLGEVFTGQGVPIDGPSAAGIGGEASHHTGWLLPVVDADGDVLGALALFVDVTPAVEPHRRVLQTATQEIKDATSTVRLVAERLTRAARITPERFAADLARVIEGAGEIDRLTHDLMLFGKITGGGMQLNTRPGDLGGIVRAACEELSPPAPDPNAPPSSTSAPMPRSSVAPPSSLSIPPARPAPSPVRVTLAEAPGAWDPEVIRWIVLNLIMVARKNGMDGGEIGVSVSATRDAVAIVVRGEGKALREEEIDPFDPLKRIVGAPSSWRGGIGLGLFLARELSHAHGGRLALERAGMGSFAMRVSFPTAPLSRR